MVLFSFCESLACSLLIMILALAAIQVATGKPVPQIVYLRTALSGAHTSPGSTAPQTPAVVPVSQQVSETQIAPTKKNYTPPSLPVQGPISKRGPSETSHSQVPAPQLVKKRKVVAFSSAAAGVSESLSRGSLSTSAALAKTPSGHLLSPTVHVPPVSCSLTLSPEQAGVRRLVRTRTRGTSGKRFKPPKMMRPAAPASGDVEHAQITIGLHSEGGARTGAQLTTIRHQYLDFPATMVPPALSPIKLPPSLAERRLVQRWAIILSGLSEKERFRCCFVSKLIRYAGKRRLPQSFECMHTQPPQCIHQPTISSAKTSLGNVYPLCCNSMAHLHL